MKVLAPWVATMVVSVFLAGCGGQEETGEKSTAGEGTTEKTNDRAEATAEVTTATTAVASSETEPEPIRDAIEPQKEERANASPEEATREGNQAQREDISVTHEAAPDPATVGRPVTFTIVVTNNSQPQHVGLKDFFAPSMTLVSATPGQGYCGPPHHGSHLFDCTLGVIPTGSSVVVEVVAVPTIPGTVTNTAQAGGGFAPVESVPATVTVNP
ncbi:MAG TPA: hypothetical protein VK361_10800 [Rubrobacteraceae bacterium]|nr:hypothetical protein [Rubrobacteraceae bacterium]